MNEGVSTIQPLTSKRTHEIVPAHRRLLLSQRVDPGSIVKALAYHRTVSKNYNEHSRDLPPLEAADTIRIR